MRLSAELEDLVAKHDQATAKAIDATAAEREAEVNISVSRSLNMT